MASPKKIQLKKQRPKRLHRSKFETNFNELCKEEGFDLGYETSVLPFTTEVQKRRYIPDWTIKSGWYIETKGRLVAADRRKMLYVKQQHPEARILVVFQRYQNKLYPGSPTTYGEWATKNDIEWCAYQDKYIWLEFIQEALGIKV